MKHANSAKRLEIPEEKEMQFTEFVLWLSIRSPHALRNPQNFADLLKADRIQHRNLIQ